MTSYGSFPVIYSLEGVDLRIDVGLQFPVGIATALGTTFLMAIHVEPCYFCGEFYMKLWKWISTFKREL